MTAAIGTSRELKNKETGIDISVPEYREIGRYLTSYEEYHVIVITTLSYFKNVKNRMSETVQFMVARKYADFEALHKALVERFPATCFPDLPRKVLMVKDSKPKERRLCFDNLMKFIASNPKTATCRLVLLFLGVQAEVISRVESGQDGTETEEQNEENQEPEWVSQRRSKGLSSGSQQSSLFSEDNGGDEVDFFQDDTGVGSGDAADGTLGTAKEEEEDEENSLLFNKGDSKKDSDLRLFPDNFGDDSANIGNVSGNFEDISDNVTDLYFPPGATVESDANAVTMETKDEDVDLFSMEDDMNKLLSDVMTRNSPSAQTSSPKPSVPNKPITATKPEHPANRPVPAKRPAVSAGKPRPAPKPAPRRTKPADNTTGAHTTNAMDDGDILKYITENATDKEANLDLF